MDGLLPVLPQGSKAPQEHENESNSEWMDDAESEEIFNRLNQLRLTIEFKLRSSGAFDTIEEEFYQLTSFIRQLESNFQQQKEDHEFWVRSSKKNQTPSSQSPAVSRVDLGVSAPSSSSPLSVAQSSESSGSAPQGLLLGLPSDMLVETIPLRPEQPSHETGPMVKRMTLSAEEQTMVIHNRWVVQGASEAEIKKIIILQRCIASRNSIRSPRFYHIVRCYLHFSKSDPAETQTVKRRNSIIREIITSETTYLSQLQLFIKYFLLPLEERVKVGKTDLVTSKDLNELFSNIKVIYSYSQFLHKELTAGDAKWPEKPFFVGRTLLQVIPFLKEYGIYISSYRNSLTTLERCKKRNANFKRWVTEVEAQPQLQQLDFVDFSIMPVQRIPRYVLLIEELLDKTPCDHVDYEYLMAALLRMRELAAELNEAQRLVENSRLMYELQRSIGRQGLDLLQPHRFLVRDGLILKLSDQVKKRHMYLFNDVILLCKEDILLRSDGQFDYIPLNTASIDDLMHLQNGFNIRYVSDISEYDNPTSTIQAVNASLPFNLLKIFDSGNNPNASHPEGQPRPVDDGTHSPRKPTMRIVTLIADSVDSKARWMKDITNCIVECVRNLQDGSGNNLSQITEQRKTLTLSYDKNPSSGSSPEGAKTSGPAQPPEKTSINGFLLRQEGSFKRWRIRWITVVEGIMYVCDDQKSPEPRRTFPMHEYVLRSVLYSQDIPGYVVQLLHDGGRHFITLAHQEKSMIGNWIRFFRRTMRVDPRCFASPSPNPPTSVASHTSAAVAASVRAPQTNQQANRRSINLPGPPAQSNSHQGNAARPPNDLGLEGNFRSVSINEMFSFDSSPSLPSSSSSSSSQPQFGSLIDLSDTPSPRSPFSSDLEETNLANSPMLMDIPTLPIMGGSTSSSNLLMDSLSSTPTPAPMTKTTSTPNASVPPFVSSSSSSLTPQSQPRPAQTLQKQAQSQPQLQSPSAAGNAASRQPQKSGIFDIFGKKPTAAPASPQPVAPAASGFSLHPGTPSAPAHKDPFQEKFGLPASEKPIEYFTLATGGYIYVTEMYVCIENIIKKEKFVVQIQDITALHKEKDNIWGKGTGGRMELYDGRIIELAGILKRKDCFQRIVDQGFKLGYVITMRRDGPA